MPASFTPPQHRHTNTYIYYTQVAAKSMPLSSLILGIDLAPIKPVRGCKSLVGDITSANARQAIRREAGGSLFDVVLHDGAPNVSRQLRLFGCTQLPAYAGDISTVGHMLFLLFLFLSPLAHTASRTLNCPL